MKNPFQKVTQKNIVTMSTVGALAVVAVITSQISNKTQNSRVVDANIEIKDGVATVQTTYDSSDTVSVTSSNDKPASEVTAPTTVDPGKASDAPESVVVTQPSPGTTKVEGKNFTLTVDTSHTPNTDNGGSTPDATPAPTSSNSITLPEDSKTRLRIRSSSSEDSSVESSTRTRIRTNQNGDTTTIRYDSN